METTLTVRVEFRVDEARGLYVASSTIDGDGRPGRELATVDLSLLSDDEDCPVTAAFVQTVRLGVAAMARRHGGEVAAYREGS